MGKHPPFKELEASRADFDTSYEPHTTKVPEPNFTSGQGLNDLPYAKHFDPRTSKIKTLVPEEHAKGDIYKASTPRPIAFVSTQAETGAANLAPMSYFNMVAHDPPTLMVSVQAGSKKHSDGMKDTNHNIKQTKEFCVSIISEPFLEAANYTSIDAPNEVDEWKLSGLTKRKSETVKPAHVAESAFSMECELMHWYDIIGADGQPANSVILGRIKRFHVNEYVLSPEDPMKVLTERLRPVARLGGITYSRSNQLMEIPRPVWDEVKDDPAVKAVLSREDKVA